MVSRVGFVVLCAIVVVSGFLIGFLCGFFSRKPDTKYLDLVASLTRDADSSISKRLLDEVKADNIRDYLRELTAKPHMAGTPADLSQAEELMRFWRDEAGLDRVQLYPFDVLLSYPDPADPNRVVITEGGGRHLFTSQLYEKILRPEQNQSDVVPPFNAYSAAGQPQGDLVYVNYARVDDFTWLIENEHIEPAGKICIARYGKIFRGDKALFAERNGCTGLILYSDPADYALDGQASVYPDSWFMPGSGVQRGSLYLQGDPLTPGYPSIKSAYRLAEDETPLPRIPVQPIGYDDARVLLGNMTGREVNPDWKGKLNITYRLGPGFVNARWKTQMFIKTHTKNVTTYNAMGFIEGAVEPDRYVMLGNHRDAWVFGALDPSSGTAAMMEISRALGAMLKSGWRPRRTIVFCSWGAEEQGIIGSREWVEFYGKMLAERAVAYLNVDIAVQGNFSFRGKTMPMLHQLMFDAAKEVPNPDPVEVSAGRTTMYDTWRYRTPAQDSDGKPTGLPRIQTLGSGSDFAPFVTKVGVACVDLRYNYDTSLGLSSYPMYHSVYETFHLVQSYYDPHFTYHRAISQYWGELARRLADDYVLPFDVNQYGTSLRGYVQALVDNYGQLMEATGANSGLAYLHQAVDDFVEAGRHFTEEVAKVDREQPMRVRMYNDLMMQIDRMFIDPNGLPGRPLIRNVIFAPSQHNTYAGSTLPGLTDSLYELDRASSNEETQKVKVVKQQMAIITFSIEAAAGSIRNILL